MFKKIKEKLIKKLGGYTTLERETFKEFVCTEQRVNINKLYAEVQYPIELYDSLCLPDGVKYELQRELGKILWDNGFSKTQCEKDHYSHNAVVQGIVSVVNVE